MKWRSISSCLSQGLFQFPKVVFVALLPGKQQQMLHTGMHPWVGQTTRVLTAQRATAVAIAVSHSPSPVRGLMCTARLHLPVIFITALPVGHEGAFYPLHNRKIAQRHTVLSHAIPLSQWPQKFQRELWFFWQRDVRADTVHLFHAEYPSAPDYPDLSYAALELVMCRRKVFYHTLWREAYTYTVSKIKIAPVLCSFSATRK